MVRVIFRKDVLREYLSSVKAEYGITHQELSRVMGIDRHTLSDWQKGKILAKLENLQIVQNKYSSPLPKIISSRPENWNSSRAATVKNQIYGCTLTTIDRVKGGRVSQLVRKENPDHYRKLGCNVRHNFTYPKHTTQFAEFVGIILGDGHIDSNGQFSVTLNSIADKQYIGYVTNLINTLFNYQPSIHKKRHCRAVSIYLSGQNMI